MKRWRDHILSIVRIFLLAPFLLTPSLLFSQSRLDSIRRMLEQAPVQEKVYLHLDNNCYYKGDTIWYKSYVVRADNLDYTDMSHILYVESAEYHRLARRLRRRQLRLEGLALLWLLRAASLHPLDAQFPCH